MKTYNWLKVHFNSNIASFALNDVFGRTSWVELQFELLNLANQAIQHDVHVGGRLIGTWNLLGVREIRW